VEVPGRAGCLKQAVKVGVGFAAGFRSAHGAAGLLATRTYVRMGR
jgi:hypothetical protein